MEKLIAVLDANILFAAALRDTLLRAGQSGIYRMFWTLEILEETRRNLVKTGKASEEQAQRLIRTITNVFPLALVVADYQSLIPNMRNQIKDRHVLAAAITCGAQVIVTNNLRDFPNEALKPHQIIAQSPDAFLIQLYQRDAALMAQVLRTQAAELRNPPLTTRQILDILAKTAPTFATLMRDYLTKSEKVAKEES